MSALKMKEFASMKPETSNKCTSGTCVVNKNTNGNNNIQLFVYK